MIRTNENYYKQRHSKFQYEKLLTCLMQERSMSISRGYLVVIFLHCLTQLKAMNIENIMNVSDTEFVAENESIISTNVIRKEEICDQSSSVSVPEASIHILPTQNQNETNTLGQNEPNSASAIQCTSNQSPSPATQRTSNQSLSPVNERIANQSTAAATQCTVNKSPAAVVTRRSCNQPSNTDMLGQNEPNSTVTLPKYINKQKQSSMIKDKTKNKKVNASSDENNTNNKKGSVP